MSTPTDIIRPALAADADSIIAFDHIAQNSPDRRQFIRNSVAQGQCHVFDHGGCILAYAVLEHSFYANGWIAMLYVASAFRHRGFGTPLMHEMERLCRTPKLFTSTNQSNHPMRRLLAKLGYQPSGVIENLDENDPELVFLKRLPDR